ncbi:MAG: hypothetical protein IJF37_10695 [Lachnospiraceae bacterium]|nr:hypothetical protein [Lachnospiraceae bacterium]
MTTTIKNIYNKSIFTDNFEETIKDTNYINRHDEHIVSQMAVGTLAKALEIHPKIKNKLTETELSDLIYSMICTLNDTPLEEIMEESNKFDLSV